MDKSENDQIPMADRKKYLDSTYQYLQHHVNDSTTRRQLFHVAAAYFEIEQKNDFLAVSKRAKNYAIRAQDTVSIAKALAFIGDYYEDQMQVDSAFYYYNESEKFYQKLRDSENYGRMLLYKAGILYDAGNFTEGEASGVKALGLLSKTKNTRLIYESYVIVALCLKNQNNYTMALSYLDLALKQIDVLEKEGYAQNKVVNSRASCYNNIGQIHERMGNNDEAITLYNKALSTTNLKNERPKLYAMLLNNLAHAEMNSGDISKVESKLFEALHIRDSLDISSGIVSSKLTLGDFYLYKKDTAKALQNIKEAYHLARKIKSSTEVLQSLKLLSEHDENHDYYTERYFEVSDSVQHVERVARDKFARIAFETEQIQEKNELLSKRNSIILSISIAFILTVVVSFVIMRLRGKNKELLYIQEQQAANEKIYELMMQQQTETETARKEERNRIAMELHDGIVNSIFTTRFNLAELETTSEEKKQQLIAELKRAEEEVRRVSHDLQQNLLFEDQNLAEILTHLVASQQNEFQTVFDLTVDKYIDWTTVSTNNKIHIYRIIQEALQNVNKYAKAQKCFLMLLRTGDKITIRIWDDGVGFNSKAVKSGIGLKNITERATLLGGVLKITSKPDEGTKIELVF